MLTAHEIGLILDFRRLKDRDKEEISDLATFKLNKQKKKPADAANINRQALKILSTTERKSL